MTKDRIRVSSVPTTRQEIALVIERAGWISGGFGGSRRGSSGPKIGFSGCSLIAVGVCHASLRRVVGEERPPWCRYAQTAGPRVGDVACPVAHLRLALLGPVG